MLTNQNVPWRHFLLYKCWFLLSVVLTTIICFPCVYLLIVTPSMLRTVVLISEYLIIGYALQICCSKSTSSKNLRESFSIMKIQTRESATARLIMNHDATSALSFLSLDKVSIVNAFPEKYLQFFYTFYTVRRAVLLSLKKKLCQGMEKIER